MIERNGKKGVRFWRTRAGAGRGRTGEGGLVDKEGSGAIRRGCGPKSANGEEKVAAKSTADYDEVTRVLFFIFRVDGVWPRYAAIDTFFHPYSSVFQVAELHGTSTQFLQAASETSAGATAECCAQYFRAARKPV